MEDFERIETETVRHLANAAEALFKAMEATRLGFVTDHCSNALREIHRAMIEAIGVEPDEGRAVIGRAEARGE